MKIDDYNAGDKIEVLINNPENDNKPEWRKGEVLDKRMIYPNTGKHHNPYPILIVRTRRTYCKATPVYGYIGNIPIFVSNDLEFYEKDNDEGFIYDEQVRLRTY